MNKYKEADEWVSRIKDDYARIDVDWAAIDQIRDLLSKTKPLRPDSISYGIIGDIPKCRNCNTVWAMKSIFYCYICGRRIVWKKEREKE